MARGIDRFVGIVDESDCGSKLSLDSELGLSGDNSTIIRSNWLT